MESVVEVRWKRPGYTDVGENVRPVISEKHQRAIESGYCQLDPLVTRGRKRLDSPFGSIKGIRSVG